LSPSFDPTASGSPESFPVPWRGRPAFDADIETAVLLGEAFGIEQALLAHPAIALNAYADDMDRELISLGVEALA
jgi:hypothetical protein